MDPRKNSDGTSKIARPLGREQRRWPRLPSSEAEVPDPQDPPALVPLSFSTRDLVREDQFGAWQTLLAPLVDVRLPDGVFPSDGFPADHTAWNLGSMLIVQQRAPAHSYIRSDTKLRSSSIDHWYVALLRTGRAWTEVDGRVALGKPGTMELRSLGHPFRGRTTESESLFLYLPRELFEHSAAALDAKNNSTLSGNVANLLIDYISGIEARLHALSANDLPRIVHATRDMIMACFSPSKDQTAVAEHLAGVALMERARRYIQGNLDAIDLTPDTVCRALGISRTRLYQLFEPNGGVSHYIQRRRLLTAHAALSDPEETRRIIDIAEAVGFNSAANFSRAFSKEFGYSPREARNAMAMPRFVHSISAFERDTPHSFEDWLKMLGS
ncbi:AraC family transcriptional regulator [Mesorhizobium sp. M00.F.Ca.ET.216.01.1.1]|uniref:helix-turn-helix domain-containing protein n=1 Tax=Mesorhizobium sp. M00.F.Ca.ET.216.01.1.1 TaxID=2500528 RepID=UPI000FD72D39|nr:AraC family transcriptional regulator [Mesorhizobium sp. M00.F.Ca.ET.216.01.1.1]TGQ38329.1 AraC family transcriptional regulator [Mesorhizobium sp. M00.F.Ca.ET.216.01.1.1]